MAEIIKKALVDDKLTDIKKKPIEKNAVDSAANDVKKEELEQKKSSRSGVFIRKILGRGNNKTEEKKAPIKGFGIIYEFLSIFPCVL